MKKLLGEASANSTQEEALIIRTALIRYLGWDVRVHETLAFLGYDPKASGGKRRKTVMTEEAVDQSNT